MNVVSNSTPLIALAKINRLDLLEKYFGEIFVPGEVYDECPTRGEVSHHLRTEPCTQSGNRLL
jgi:Predicted nucleic acid-binding protein, contains PIN domain